MLAAGLPGLRFNADYKAYFDSDDPFLQQLITIEKRFETTDNIVVILSREIGSILEPEAYRLVTRLTERSWELPYIHRVQSIASLALPSNVDEGSFFEEGQSGTSHGDKRLEVPDISVLSKHPRVSGLLISEDTRTAAINLFFHFPAQDTATELPHAADAVRQYFPTTNAFRVATDLANHRLSGITIVDYSLDTNKENGIFDPEYLNTVAAFAGWFKKQEFVTRISAVTDWLTLLDQDTQISRFTEGDVSRYARRLANRRPSELNLSHEITEDYSATRLRAFINNSDNRNIVHLDHKAREWLKDNAFQYEVTGGAGPSLVFAHIGHRNVQGMLYSLLIAVSVTALLIGMVTRSLYAILICLVCNLIPIVWVFGIWTLVDGRLSLGAAVVVGMILGIIVDDSIHFIVKYFAFSRQAIGSGLSPLEQVYAKVGPALVATTLTLAAGLAVGCLSDFRPISVMSALSVAIIIVALAVDLTLLPALLTSAPQRSNRNPLYDNR